MLKFISFGSGSCGNCYYIYTEETGLIIDVGIGFRRIKKYFLDYGLSMQHIKNILITHDHADHVKAVGALSNTLGLPVYATKQVHEGIKRNYCVKKKIDVEHIRYLNTNENLVLDDFDIKVFKVPHDSLENVGFSIKHKDTTFCIMTDIGHVTEEMSQAIGDADYLIIEANHDEEMLKAGPYPEHLKRRINSENGHLSNKQCAKAISNFATEKLKHVWLCHLSQENNHPELARKTVEIEIMNSQRIDTTAIKIDVLKRSAPCDICELR